MEGKMNMKDLYKVFGKKKNNDNQMDSISNIFYDLGNKEETDIKGQETKQDKLRKLLK